MNLADAIDADLSASTDPHATQALDLLTAIVADIKGGNSNGL